MNKANEERLVGKNLMAHINGRANNGTLTGVEQEALVGQNLMRAINAPAVPIRASHRPLNPMAKPWVPSYKAALAKSRKQRKTRKQRKSRKARKARKSMNSRKTRK